MAQIHSAQYQLVNPCRWRMGVSSIQAMNERLRTAVRTRQPNRANASVNELQEFSQRL
jgi:hypothetical protein